MILAYHGLGEAPPDSDPHHLLVHPDRFRTHVGLLSEAGFQFITVAELAARTPAGGTPPPGLAAISFDDGMEDNFSEALPILRELGIPATVYVLTGAIGAPNPWLSPKSGRRMMNGEELRALAQAGLELGAHTVTHPDLSRLDAEACLKEMTESKDAVEEITGEPVRTFAYPFGHYGPAAMQAARAAGFEAAVTCVNRGSWDPFELKRTLVTGRDGLGSFLARVSGIYEPLVLSRAGTAARRATAGVRSRLRARRGT